MDGAWSLDRSVASNDGVGNPLQLPPRLGLIGGRAPNAMLNSRCQAVSSRCSLTRLANSVTRRHCARMISLNSPAAGALCSARLRAAAPGNSALNCSIDTDMLHGQPPWLQGGKRPAHWAAAPLPWARWGGATAKTA